MHSAFPRVKNRSQESSAEVSMLKFLERKYQPLAPPRIFYNRLVKCFLLTLAIIAFSLVMGTTGYHCLGDLDWLDALLNASMILTGM